MNQFSTASSTRPRSAPTAGLPALLPLIAMILAAAPAAWAGTTDISTQPLVTLPTAQAKPNLLFVMDSSGSMNWSYMPDNLGLSRSITNEPFDGHGGRVNWYGYWSAQCNGLAFDPNADYSPPLRADGTSYPHVSYTNAPTDGYAFDAGTSTTTTDLSNSSDSYYYQYSGTQTVMGWTYTTSGVTSNTFYKECSSQVGNAPGSSVFTQVLLSNATTAVQQKYADWYAYYAHRYLLMRTAMGRAISVLDSNYRVGFSTIYDTTAKDGSSNFVDVKDFDATQKGKFYKNLYAVAPSGGTNLPDALSEAGRYYAHQIKNQTADPVQYACQRNYTLISTDGYWNTNSADYGLDGKTRVGEQDDAEARPMKDSSGDSSTKTVTSYTAPVTATYTSALQTRTVTWTRKTVSSVASPGTGTGTSATNCTKSGYFIVSTTTQTATETQTQQSTAPHTGTSSYTTTLLATNGVTTSTSSTTPATAWDAAGTASFAYTDNNATSGTTSQTSNTPIDPPAASYSAASPVKTCVKPAPTSGVTDTSSAGSWSSASPYTDVGISIASYTAGTPVTTTTATYAASSDTLADVAEYYYKSDLRTKDLGNCSSTSSGGTQDVCNNIVKAATADPATWQHMNTFTIGLGTSGTLQYDKNYLTQASGTYVDLTSGAAIWPVATTSGNANNIDDLWHAAVNGRGQYYSALNATLLAEAISGVVNIVQQQSGSGASASTSSLQLIAGDNNLVYQASYTTGSWTGDLLAYGINGDDATVDATPTWSAQDKLDKLMDKQTTSPRTIYYNSGTSSAPSLTLLTWSSLTSTQKAYFANICPTSPVTSGVTAKATLLGQCSGLTGADLTAANNGSNMLDYLSGVRTYEAKVDPTTTVPLYRKRDHVLGDIIDGAPVYIGKPPFKYSDAGYADFVTAKAGRKAVVYTAANDGMLHAFSAASSDGGTELWAYVPTLMMPNLYLLADSSYASRHRYFVDGAPVMGDIKVGTAWKTILVGGFNDGGSGYYALDITDPTSPKLLWEFTDTNLGLSYGNPVITKRVDGTWVVVFGSGYNNADGLGHLFVLDANAGTKLLDIKTPAGSANAAGPTNPSGLAKVNAWIESDSDNTATRFYGGDLLGNLWRFDIDSQVKPYQSSMLLAQFLLSGSTPQPITTRPVPIAVSVTSGTRAVVIVGTGRYLGTSDISDKTQQSIYAIADDLKDTGWGDVRSGTNASAFVQQTLTVDTTANTASDSNTAVNFSDPAIGGWWLDLPNSGERVATNMSVQYNTLVVGSAIPTGNVCDSGGQSWRYFLNATSGGAVSSNPVGALWDANALMVGQGWIVDAAGNTRILEVGSNGKIKTEVPPTIIPSATGGGHRTSWRELTN